MKNGDRIECYSRVAMIYADLLADFCINYFENDTISQEREMKYNA